MGKMQKIGILAKRIKQKIGAKKIQDIGSRQRKKLG